MTTTTRIRVATYNLEEGGIDDGDDNRLREQLAMLAGLDLHVLALQEAKRWHQYRWRRLHQAAHLLDMEAYAVRSRHHACHLALFVKEPVEFVEELHDRQAPMWHALCQIRARVHGQTLYLANAHFAPSAPDIRHLEAQACALIPKRGPAIFMGDLNAASATDPTPPPGEYPPEKVRQKFDRRPAQALEAAGLLDMGAILGDTTPTVGHRGDPPHRCGRIHTNLPREALISHRVIQEEDPKSNHCAVLAEVAITTS